MFVESNGVTFHVQVDGTGPPLLLLHGFTGSTASWDELVPHLSPCYRLIRVDLIGHGQTDSPADPTRYSMAHAVADLIGLLDHLEVEQCAVVGYSMGARIAMHLALEVPRRVHHLMLESGTYGIVPGDDRAQRVQKDEALARRIEADGIRSFAEQWEALPLFASQAALPKGVLQKQRQERLAQTPRGLAHSLRGMGTGKQDCLKERLKELSMPTLLICGERDDKFTRLNEEMHRLIPDSELIVVPSAGHNVHLERPDVFIHRIRHFLKQAKTTLTWNESQEDHHEMRS